MAREGLLVNAGEDTIHTPGEKENRPKTPKQKWQNFWYYHKWHMIGGVLVTAVLVLLIHDITTRVEPDYQIGLLTALAYPQESLAPMQERLEQYGEDLNGDGKVVVRVSNYVQSDLDQGMNPNAQMAGRVQLMADVSVGQSMIFITEDPIFRENQEDSGMFSYLDGTLPPEGAADYENMRVPVSECKALDGLGLPDEWSISLRIYTGSQIEGKKLDPYYEQSRALFNRIRSGEKPPAASSASPAQ